MTHPKIRLFLFERDRATARQDWGIVRSLTADLRRWNVPDDATSLHPSGAPTKAAKAVTENESASPDSVVVEEARKGGRPKLPRCEHGNVSDRCPDCNEELAAH